MPRAVEWKRLFSALKISKIGFIRVRSKIPFYERFSWLTRVDIFFTSGTRVRCVETASFLTFCIRGFYIALKAI